MVVCEDSFDGSIYRRFLYKFLKFCIIIKAMEGLSFSIQALLKLVYTKERSLPEYATECELGELSKELLQKLNINLYKHQYEVVKYHMEGYNVGVFTPTASGKTLSYLISYLEDLYRYENAKMLYIAPMNSLINDQATKIRSYLSQVVPWIKVGVLTGGTSDFARKQIKNESDVILTNPEMLVFSMFLYHTSGWENFWKNLKIIVVDEVHDMSGVKGSHFGNILRILNMLNDYYNNNAKYISLSATVGNPEEFIRNLFGKPFKIVSNNTSGSQKVEFYFPSEYFVSQNPSVNFQSIELVRKFFEIGKKGIVFTKDRKRTEKIFFSIKRNSRLSYLTNYVYSYRSGYDHDTRVGIENAFRNGKLKCLISTSALELGIDIVDIDFIVNIGFPFSKISLFQRFGRTGRIRDGIGIFLPTEDALDKYYYRHPEELFDTNFEQLSSNIYNERIIGYYIAIASIVFYELSNIYGDFAQISEELVAKYWGEDAIYSIEKFVNYQSNVLKNNDILVIGFNKDMSKFYTTRVSKEFFRKNLSIRSIGRSLDIQVVSDDTKGRKIGEISISRVFYEASPESIYLHEGEPYRVKNIDLKNYVVSVEKLKKDQYNETETLVDKYISVLSVLKEKIYKGFSLKLCKVKVEETIRGFVEYKFVSENRTLFRKIIRTVEYPNPYVVKYDTDAILIDFDGESIKKIIDFGKDKETILEGNNRSFDFKNQRLNLEKILLMGLHAGEHSIIGMYPSEVVCQRSEIGGLSSVSEYSSPRIYIYEGIEGGIGYSEKAFKKFENIVLRAYEVISNCDCEEDSGCPSCIQSPKCGNANYMLSKYVGKKVLDFLISNIREGEKENNKIGNIDFSSPAVIGKVTNYLAKYLKSELPEIENNVKYGRYNLLEYDIKKFYFPIAFDLETKKYSFEVGGWENAKDMLLSVAVVYDIKADEFLIFTEDNVKTLVEILFDSDFVLGYNTRNFDYKVLSRYDPRFEIQDNIKTFDILNDLLKKYIGDTRVSLFNLIISNIDRDINRIPSEDIPRLFREGQIEKVIEHCKQDVFYTYKVLEKILRDRSISFYNGHTMHLIEFDEVIFRFKI